MKRKQCNFPAYLAMLAASYGSLATANEYLDMGLEQLMQVNVTGSTLRDESLKTVPAAVTVFTRNQLQQLGFDYLYELVNLVPGYQSIRNADRPAAYTMSARGRRNSFDAREILLLVDGRVFADPRSGSADSILRLFPLEEIEQVEIIRGPGSALYGSSAFSGVINVTTRRNENNLKVAAGSQGRRTATVHLSQEQDEWEATLFARAYEDNGQRNRIADRYIHTPVASDDPRRSFDADLGLGYGNTQLRAAYHRLVTEDFYSSERIYNGFNDASLTLRQVSLEHEHYFVDTIKTHFSLGYLDTTQDVAALNLPPGYLATLSQPASADPLLLKILYKANSWRFSWANDWSISTLSSAQFGLDWHDNSEESAHARNNFDYGQYAHKQFPVTYYGDFSHLTQLGSHGTQKASGIYGQYLRQLGEDTRLTLGARYDDYSDMKEHFSPRLGVVQQLTGNQSVKLLYGEAFRAPSLSEIGVINNALLVANGNLSYEIVKTWDFIWMGSWNDTHITLNGFRNEYEYPIFTGVLNTSRTYMNGKNERSSGLEFEASQQLTPQWLVRATYTTFFNLPDSAFREAEQLASVMVNYEQGALNLNLAAVHHGERDTFTTGNAIGTLDDYWLANAKLRYEFSARYAISLQAKNLFDKDYRTPAQNAGIPLGVVNRRREWNVGFDWSF